MHMTSFFVFSSLRQHDDGLPPVSLSLFIVSFRRFCFPTSGRVRLTQFDLFAALFPFFIILLFHC